MHPALEVFLLFLRIGFTGFGGPLANTALFEEEFVRKRGWLSRESFLHHLTVTQLIPGPNSTELAMHLGYKRAGWIGFLLAGTGFILPGIILVSVLGILYVSQGGFQEIQAWAWGTKPVIAAVIATMIVRTGRQALKPSAPLIPVLLGFVLFILGAPILTSLMAAAGIWMLFFRFFPMHSLAAFLLAIVPLLAVEFSPEWSPVSPTAPALFLHFLYLGSAVVGSGYVVFSLFAVHLVDRLQWIDADSLAMTIAASQVSPGPLFASSAFIGQILQGWTGALACAAGIFLPAFFFGALSLPLMKQLEKNDWWREIMRVLTGLCILILAREAIRLAPLFLDHAWAYGFFAAALVLYLRFRVNPLFLVAGGALLGGFIR